MQFPMLKTFVVCREIEGSFEDDGQFSLRDILRRGVTLERPLAENERASVHLEIYVDLFTREPVEPGSFRLEIASVDGIPFRYEPSGHPPTREIGFPNVPGGVAFAITWNLDKLPLGEFTLRPFWGDRLLGEFPFRVKDREDNPRLAERLTAQAG